jgi:hypothetical protein
MVYQDSCVVEQLYTIVGRVVPIYEGRDAALPSDERQFLLIRTYGLGLTFNM